MLKQASGAIVNVASTAGLNPLANRAAYCANKAGVIGLTRQMALQYSRQGVRVNAICPGWVNTEMAKGINNFPKEAMTQPNDIANIWSNLLELSNSSVPFEVALNCQLEKTI